jgi:outer membrane protein assembly factor BamD
VDEATRDGAVLGANYPGDRWYTAAYSLLTTKGLKPQTVPAPKTTKVEVRRRG